MTQQAVPVPVQPCDQIQTARSFFFSLVQVRTCISVEGLSSCPLQKDRPCPSEVHTSCSMSFAAHTSPQGASTEAQSMNHFPVIKAFSFLRSSSRSTANIYTMVWKQTPMDLETQSLGLELSLSHISTKHLQRPNAFLTFKKNVSLEQRPVS
jgi:hypothetical protein